MNKALLIVLILAIVVVGIWFLTSYQPAPQQAASDSTTSIARDLNTVNIDTLDQTFQGVDASTNSL